MPIAKVVVLLDLANISYAFDIVKETRKMPGIKLDYVKLVSAITIGYNVLSKTVYIAAKDYENEKLQIGFLNYFKKDCFNVVTKKCKLIRKEDESSMLKANFDVEITFDTCLRIFKRECEEIVLISGDSDFTYLIKKAKEQNIRITIVSSRASISSELRLLADRIILIDDLDLVYFGFNGEKK